MDISTNITEKFGHKIRVRVNALIWQGDKLLLIKHRGLGPEGILYAPPGGGTEFGSGLEENLLREIKEETGILIEENQFQFVHEYIAPPLHAIELFFSVTTYSGTLLHGSDPELGKNEQIIEWVGFMAWPELKGLPPKQLHQILKSCPTPKSLKSISGLVKFGS